MDGLHWSSDTFKNQAYNLRRGRVDLLRQHVAYKSAAILQVVRHAPEPPELVLIGDNAESDPVIYLGIKLFLEGHLGREGYRKYLEIAGVEPDLAEAVIAKYAYSLKGSVSRIFIRSLGGKKIARVSPLTSSIHEFASFSEVAFVECLEGGLHPGWVWQLVRTFHNRHGAELPDLLVRLYALRDSERLPQEARGELQAVIDRLEGVQANCEVPAKKVDPFAGYLSPEPIKVAEDELLHAAAGWIEAQTPKEE